jgi:vacuolar-type H+-ATPase subunit H
MGTMKLGTWFPEEYEAWGNRRTEIEERFQKIIAQGQAEIHVEKDSGALESAVREAVIDEILKAFPSALTVHLRL